MVVPWIYIYGAVLLQVYSSVERIYSHFSWSTRRLWWITSSTLCLSCQNGNPLAHYHSNACHSCAGCGTIPTRISSFKVKREVARLWCTYCPYCRCKMLEHNIIACLDDSCMVKTWLCYDYTINTRWSGEATGCALVFYIGCAPLLVLSHLWYWQFTRIRIK